MNRKRAAVDANKRQPRAAAIVVAPTIVGNLALTMWYLVRPQANASRTGIAARVYGRTAT